MSSSVVSIALWQKRVGELLPGLSQSQAMVLGLLSYGMVILDGRGLSRLSKGLAKIEQVKASRLRQRLREFYYEAEAKRGKKRREVSVQACFGDLLRGVLRGWEGSRNIECIRLLAQIRVQPGHSIRETPSPLFMVVDQTNRTPLPPRPGVSRSGPQSVHGFR